MDATMSARPGAQYRVVVVHAAGPVASMPMTLTAALDEHATTCNRYASELGPGGVDVFVIDDRDWPPPQPTASRD